VKTILLFPRTCQASGSHRSGSTLAIPPVLNVTLCSISARAGAWAVVLAPIKNSLPPPESTAVTVWA